MIHKLNEKVCLNFIKRCAAAGKRDVRNDGGGLYLTAGPTGAASWLFRYEKEGKRHDMGLGAFHTFSLAEAREKARLARQQLHNGADPLTEKRRVKAAVATDNPASKPFKYCAEQFILSRESGWRCDKHRRDWENSLSRYADPVIGKMMVSDITREHVLKVLQPHWVAKTETMLRVRGRLELVLDWAGAMGFRTGANPAIWKGNLDALLNRKVRKETKHFAALDYKDLPALVAELQQDQSTAGKGLLFTIFTCLRTSETLGLQWDHVDFASQSITVPAELMKMNRPHRVPLAPEPLAILAALNAVRTTCPYVFTTGTRGKPLPNRAMLDLFKELRPGLELTVHGSTRSGFSTWRGEETSFADEVAEACLAHAKKDKVVEAYNRGSFYKKRCELMAAWVRFCCTPIGDNVTPIRQVS